VPKLKKITTLSLSTILAISSFTGCSTKNKLSIEDKKELSNFRVYDKLAKDVSDKKAIEYVYISGFTEKNKDINHKVINKRINFKLPQSKLLGDLVKIGPYNISVNDYLSNKIISLKTSHINGSIEEILNQISSTANVYWTIENKVIIFKQTTQIVYTFPAMTMDRISEVYNTGETDNITTFNNDSIFKDLEQVLSGMVKTKQFTGEVKFEITDNNSYKENSSKNSSDLKNNESSETNSKENSNENNNNKNINNKSNNKSGTKIDINPSEFETNENHKRVTPTKKGKPPRRRPVRNNKNNAVKNKISNVDSKEKNYSEDNKITNKQSSSLNKDNSKNSQSSLENKKTKELENGKVINKTSTYSTIYNTNSSRIILSPSSGSVIAHVTPDEEKKLDIILDNVMEKMFGNLVQVNMYAISVSKERLKSFNFNLTSGSIFGSTTKTTTVGAGGLGYLVSQGTIADPFTKLNLAVSYLTEDKNSKILLNPKILTLPNIISRVSDTTNMPYLEPETITDSGTSNISYNVSYVKQGVNMSVLANTFDNNIILALKLAVTQYLGDKTLEAGVLGSFQLPIASPKMIQTTLRTKPGDILVLAGINERQLNVSSGKQFSLPTSYSKDNSDKEYVFLVMPTLIKFVVIKDPIKLKTMKKLNLVNNLDKVKFTKEEFEAIKKEEANQEKTYTIEEWEKMSKKNTENKSEVKILKDFNETIDTNINTSVTEVKN